MKQKELSNLPLEELWQLFAIFLTAHQSCWTSWYNEEKKLLQTNFPYIKHISHIGSTAIKDIWAKPNIDILIESSKEKQFEGKYSNCTLLTYL